MVCFATAQHTLQFTIKYQLTTMIAQLQTQYMTPQEYLEWEEQQPLKYEYMEGEVFAMTGGTLPHTYIALNLDIST